MIITDNLQNLRFYQRYSKNMNQNIFCTKSKLLTQKTVLKVSLFQFFISGDSCEAWKLTDSGELSTLIRPELFQFLKSFCTYPW